MLQEKHDKAMKWIWDYAAYNFGMGVCQPPGVSTLIIYAIGESLADNLTKIYFGNTTGEKENTVFNALKDAFSLMLSELSQHYKEYCRILKQLMGELQFPALKLVMDESITFLYTSTITLGWGLTKILDDLSAGIIDLSDIKTIAGSETLKSELRQMYKETVKQVKNDPRFAMDRFGANKK